MCGHCNLIPPPNASELFSNLLVTKLADPSFIEMQLSAKEHRWPEMNKIMNEFFQATGQLVTKIEIDLLAALGLPDIKTLRKAIKEEKSAGDWAFEYPANAKKAVDRIFSDFQKMYIGDEKVLKADFSIDDLEIYPYYEYLAFSMSAMKVLEMIVRNRMAGLSEEEIKRRRLIPSINNPYLQAMIDDGTKRVRTLVGDDLKKLHVALIDMVKEGKSADAAARYLHKQFGEGKMWYWLRFTRSEAVLAANASFMAQCKQIGVPYQRWSAGPNCCEICAALDGGTWKLGQGPEPVKSSHPFCYCTLIAIFIAETVLPNWDRATPYDQKYGSENESPKDEILRLISGGGG